MNGSARAAVLLVELLERQPAYRRKWELHAKHRGEGVSQAAVSRVLALFLWDSGERDDREIELPRNVRHRVQRALNGNQISSETLTWFIQAFEMTSADERQLWLAFSGGHQLGDGIVGTVSRPRPLARPQVHRTVSLFERYFFDSSGWLAQRHTMHVIRAVDADMDAYSVNHEPVMERLEVVAGGQLKSKVPYDGGLTNDEIWFDRPLRRNKTQAMEYFTYYRPDYHPTDVRRGIRARCDNVDIAVHFESPKMPINLRFCAWTEYYGDSTAICDDEELDERGHAHRFLPFAENSMLGFAWDWQT